MVNLESWLLALVYRLLRNFNKEGGFGLLLTEDFMKKYLLARLFESTSWIGMAIIVGAFIAPRWFIILLGLILIVSGDSWLRGWIAKHAPEITAQIEEWTK